mgnify:CR=1 FL=1
MEEQGQNQIQQIVDAAVTNIRDAAKVNTIIGQPLLSNDGSTILPVSQVSFAFVAGGGEYGKNNGKHFKENDTNQFAGGSGGGATLSPVGFLVLNNQGIKLIKFDEESTLEKLADVASSIIGAIKN